MTRDEIEAELNFQYERNSTAMKAGRHDAMAKGRERAIELQGMLNTLDHCGSDRRDDDDGGNDERSPKPAKWVFSASPEEAAENRDNPDFHSPSENGPIAEIVQARAEKIGRYERSTKVQPPPKRHETKLLTLDEIIAKRNQRNEKARHAMGFGQ